MVLLLLPKLTAARRKSAGNAKILARRRPKKSSVGLGTLKLLLSFCTSVCTHVAGLGGSAGGDARLEQPVSGVSLFTCIYRFYLDSAH